ncbi:hypothetical protein GPECTOR_71g542 [Gonium pectorale]|uniref:Uncharacterized protein n=1 Tax=Gonium pectorale TaxID=33097 RepID=A0A150G314_GONPE|nr:hypothetical protein GPECTOR_71g542 [Gonium pectorale]|eukprot:KXZ44181.1 hypothetical protein GPECTOR_71g542 [Gonium pectorale]
MPLHATAGDLAPGKRPAPEGNAPSAAGADLQPEEQPPDEPPQGRRSKRLKVNDLHGPSPPPQTQQHPASASPAGAVHAVADEANGEPQPPEAKGLRLLAQAATADAVPPPPPGTENAGLGAASVEGQPAEERPSPDAGEDAVAGTSSGSDKSAAADAEQLAAAQWAAGVAQAQLAEVRRLAAAKDAQLAEAQRALAAKDLTMAKVLRMLVAKDVRLGQVLRAVADVQRVASAGRDELLEAAGVRLPTAALQQGSGSGAVLGAEGAAAAAHALKPCADGGEGQAAAQAQQVSPPSSGAPSGSAAAAPVVELHAPVVGAAAAAPSLSPSGGAAAPDLDPAAKADMLEAKFLQTLERRSAERQALLARVKELEAAAASTAARLGDQLAAAQAQLAAKEEELRGARAEAAEARAEAQAATARMERLLLMLEREGS